MKKVLFVILFLFIAPFLKSQDNSEIDSLKTILNLSNQDTSTVILLNKIAKSYYHSDPDSTFKYAELALKISDNINYTLGKGKAYRFIGIANAGKTEFDEALKYYYLALNQFIKIRKFEDVGIVLTSIGIIFRKKNNYEAALKCYHTSIELIKLSNDSIKLAAAYTNIGVIYKIIKDYDRAMEYHMKSQEINRKANNKQGLPYSLGNIALVYKEIGDYDKAISYLNEAKLLFEELNYKNEIAQTYSVLSELYALKKNYKEAYKNIQISNKIFNETKNKAGIAETNIILGNIYLNMKQYSNAKKALLIGLDISKKTGYNDNLLKCYMYLFMLDSAENNYKGAFKYFRKYTHLRESVLNNEKNNTILEIQGKYDISEKERENLILRKDNEINEILIKRQKIITYSIGIAFILSLMSVSLIIIYYKKLKRNNKLLNNKNKKISSQNILLEEHKDRIDAQFEEISLQNEELEKFRKNLEKKVKERTIELNYALKNAQDSDNLKKEFLKNLSHEIRTPLNAISGFSDILKNDEKEIKPEYIKGIRKSMNDLLNTIDRLVILSKFQVEQYSLNPEIIDLHSYFLKLKSKTEKRKDFLEKDKISLDFFINLPELTQSFCSDKFVLNNILNELIDNAFKFTERGTISVHVSQLYDKRLCISIKDTGVGIKADLISHVFDFMRKFDTQNELYRGMGVGLTLVKKAVELLSGEIKINTLSKDGAELIIVIPECKRN